MGSLSDPPDPSFTATEEDVESSVPPPVASPGSLSDVGLVDYKVDLNRYCQSPKHLDKENLSSIEEDGLDMSTFSKLGTTQKRSKKDNGVNLRKSLAWNPAFFTEEGVLNPLELCVLGGSSLRSKEKVLSVVNGQMSPLLGGLHDRTPVNAVDRQKFYGKMDALSASKNNIQFKEENLHSKLNASIWEEQQEGEGTKSSSRIIGRVASRLATPSSQKRIANTNAANPTSKIPKLMPAKSHTTSIPMTSRDAIPSVRNFNSNTSVNAVNMEERTLHMRCFQSNTRKQSACSLSMKPSAIDCSRPLVPRINKGATESSSISKVVKGTAISSISANGSSLPKKVYGDAVLHAKPSGLRMPSPSLGFFQKGKVPRSGSQSQRTVHLFRPTIPHGKTMNVTSVDGSRISPASAKKKSINDSVAPKSFAGTTIASKMENSFTTSSLPTSNGNAVHPSRRENISTAKVDIVKEVPYASNTILQIDDNPLVDGTKRAKACSLGVLNETQIDERLSTEDNKAKQSSPAYAQFVTDAISGQDEQAAGNLHVNQDPELVLSDRVVDFSSLPATRASLTLSKSRVASSVFPSSSEADGSLALDTGNEHESKSYLRSSTVSNSDCDMISNSEMLDSPSQKPDMSAETANCASNYSSFRLTSTLEDSLTSPSASCEVQDHNVECVNEDHINSKEVESLLQNGSENEQKDNVKQDIHHLNLNAVPFSEEWLAAIETFGEDILELKTGPVQNSPPDKTLSEPGPWSPYTISAHLTDEDKETTASPSKSLDVSYGLNGALAARGVIVKEKVFHNLKKTELLKHGATSIDNLSGIPLYVRGDTLGGAPEISKAQFSKLLKQVTCHISSVSKIFVLDGVIGSPSNCDAKVRIISDNPSAMLSLSKILWETPSRAISHDSCPLTVYVASSMSSSARDILGFGSQASNGFAAADVERSSVILCGRAFANINTTKDALVALAAPVISARGGLPLSARLILSGDSVILLFAPEDTFLRCSELHKLAISSDAGVILSSHGAAPFFQTTHSPASRVIKKPTSSVIIMADSTGVVPAVSSLSSGQAAYHFLAGYQDGKFVPAFLKPPSPIEPLELAKALFLQVEESEIPSYLINANDGGRHIAGKRLLELVKSTLCDKLPESKPNAADSKVRDLKRKYKSFLSGKFIDLPEEFYF